MTETKLAQNKRYSTFYLVMLIISTLVASWTTMGLLSEAFHLGEYLRISPGYMTATILDLVGIIVADIALVYLWMRKTSEGTILITVGYGLTILGLIGEIIFAQPILQHVISHGTYDGTLTPSEQAASHTLLQFFAYTQYVVGVITLVVLVILWRVAAKKENTVSTKK